MFPYGPLPFIALVSWPLVTVVIFQKYRLPVAAAASTLGAMLFLPDGEGRIDLPLVPPLDKQSIATISVAAMVFFKHRKRLKDARWLRGVDLVPMVAMLGVIGTFLNNQEPIHYGTLAGVLEDAKSVTLPGLTSKDILAYFVRDFLYFVLPFIVARAVYRSIDDLEDFFSMFVAFAISYIPLIMIELRISPIIHGTIYGYPPHFDFTQTMRWGGWRPQVFFYHGLYLSKFMLACTMCALGLWVGKRKKAWRFDSRLTFIVLFVTTFFTKSAGVIMFMFSFTGLFLKTSRKTQARVIFMLAALTIAYPIGRATNWLDTTALIAEIKKYSPDRAQSLGYRFRNEIEVSARARKKVWFGWGGWSRAHIYDPKAGRDLTTIDGYWLLRFSYQGIFGLAGPFLVMLLPVFLTCRRYKDIPDEREQRMVLVLAGLVVMYAVDCLPNAISTNIPFVAGGALWGVVSTISDPKYIKRQKKKRRRRRPPPPWYGPPGPGYPPYAPPRAGHPQHGPSPALVGGAPRTEGPRSAPKFGALPPPGRPPRR